MYAPVTRASGASGETARGFTRRARSGPTDDAQVITIPSSDQAFQRQVEGIRAREHLATPDALETRLRRAFPRAVVRRRDISGEPTAWYVYRDGSWRPSMSGSWWEEPGLPRIEISPDGWLEAGSPSALGLLGIEPGELGTRHFTDFVAPGGLEDAVALFGIVGEGHDLTATALLRPTSGDVIAIDLHAWLENDRHVAVMRLADDVEVESSAVFDSAVGGAAPASVRCVPETDAAFRGYADLALGRMPEPTADGLALRLRRLYPHARVEVDGDAWIAHRDAADALPGDVVAWWEAPDLPRVRYDGEALILEANAAVEALLGRRMVGHYWQEFVTPGSTEQVSAMLTILAEVGHAESRFRMPRSDGSLVEFDSYTEVDGDGFTTVMRPRPTSRPA